MTSTNRPPRPPGWVGRRAIDVLVYGTAAIPIGLGLLALDSALLVAILPGHESSELRASSQLPHGAELAAFLTASAFAVLFGAAVIVSRIRYVREHPLVPPPPDTAPIGPRTLILTPLEEMPAALERVVPVGLQRVARGPFATETDVAGPSAGPATPMPEPVATGTGRGTEALVIGFGAVSITVVMLIGVPFAFVVGATALGAAGGLLVGGIVVVGGVLGFRRLHRMGEPAPTSLGLRDTDAADQGGGVGAGWVIAWSIVLTTVAMFALLVSVCGSARF